MGLCGRVCSGRDRQVLCVPQQQSLGHTRLCLSPGVSPSGPGVVVMQLNVPNGPQAPQNPPVVQWSHCKYYSLEQRGQKPGDLYNPDTSAQVLGGLGGMGRGQLSLWGGLGNGWGVTPRGQGGCGSGHRHWGCLTLSLPQASTQLNSPITSPTQSPTPSPVTNLNSVCTGLSPLPVLTQFPRPMGPAQGKGKACGDSPGLGMLWGFPGIPTSSPPPRAGDGRYSLLGQPLQYNLSLCPPPLLHNQPSYTGHQVQPGPASPPWPLCGHHEATVSPEVTQCPCSPSRGRLE